MLIWPDYLQGFIAVHPTRGGETLKILIIFEISVDWEMANDLSVTRHGQAFLFFDRQNQSIYWLYDKFCWWLRVFHQFTKFEAVFWWTVGDIALLWEEYELHRKPLLIVIVRIRVRLDVFLTMQVRQLFSTYHVAALKRIKVTESHAIVGGFRM